MSHLRYRLTYSFVQNDTLCAPANHEAAVFVPEQGREYIGGYLESLIKEDTIIRYPPLQQILCQIIAVI